MISGLNVGLSGLFAAQRALDVTAHNIANVNTPGYSRQRVEQSAARPTTGAVPMLGPGAYGRGVSITGVRQMRDALVDARILDASSDQGAADVTVDATNAAQAVVGTLDEGLGTDLSAFWSAWDELSWRKAASPTTSTTSARRRSTSSRSSSGPPHAPRQVAPSM
jgi:flagellar hook-associated protein 1 FlgK